MIAAKLEQPSIFRLPALFSNTSNVTALKLIMKIAIHRKIIVAVNQPKNNDIFFDIRFLKILVPLQKMSFILRHLYEIRYLSSTRKVQQQSCINDKLSAEMVKSKGNNDWFRYKSWHWLTFFLFENVILQIKARIANPGTEKILSVHKFEHCQSRDRKDLIYP